MGAFELDNHMEADSSRGCGPHPHPPRPTEECIISLKVYDQCRQQDCLTRNELGPARAAEHKCICGIEIHEGEVVYPPNRAATVSLDKLRIKRIIIVDKAPCQFRLGYWDVNIKYVFEYRLIFREADGHIIDTIRANSIFNKKVTLFGSIDTDIVMATDLFVNKHDSEPVEADPFILVEAKAVGLDAQLRYGRPKHCSDDMPPCPTEVDVTIGLFSIIKLFRIVQLLVESTGFCIPQPCEDVTPLNPCQFFNGLDFPMDIFAPPSNPADLAGTKLEI